MLGDEVKVVDGGPGNTTMFEVDDVVERVRPLTTVVGADEDLTFVGPRQLVRATPKIAKVAPALKHFPNRLGPSLG
ncbi:unnamed protein product [Acidithrix sp. C25]|nr:unnamed protein product [Acidithrix sp. C25]